MRLAWEGMIPATLLFLFVTSMFVYFGWQPYMWIASLLGLVIVWVVYPFMPRQANPNHRIPMIGSRFSPARDTDVVTAPTEPLALADEALPNIS
jgi:predicted MFS family arabinose efflux permease